MGESRPGAGEGGNCICPNCGAKTPHQTGAPCYNQICPKCGTRTIKEQEV